MAVKNEGVPSLAEDELSRVASSEASGSAKFWLGVNVDRTSNISWTTRVISWCAGLTGVVAGASFVCSRNELVCDPGQSSIALALLYDTLIPACALVALFISCMLVLRATQRKAAAGEGKSGWAFRRRLARFGRKSFLVSAAAVLFAFSCFYRAMNLADEGAATCRGSPTALNAPVSGRAVATVGEVALVVQVAIYIEESAVRLGATQGLWQQLWRKWTRMPFSTIFPVVVAECSSWCGVLSGNARFYCSEYVIWMLIAITWAYDGAELLHKSETFDDQLTHAVLLLAGVGLFFFNAFLEIPHFFFVERTGAEAQNHIGLWECHQSHDSPLWLKRLPFFFCYFIGCSWCSVAVAYRFLRMGKPKPRPPEQKAD